MEHSAEQAQSGRKPYATPQLVVHGDVEKLTQQEQGGPGCEPSIKNCGGGDGNSRLGPIS